MADFGEMLLRLMGIGGTGPGLSPDNPDWGSPAADGSTGPGNEFGSLRRTGGSSGGAAPNPTPPADPSQFPLTSEPDVPPIAEGRSSIALPPPLQLPGAVGGPAPAPAPIVAPPVSSTPGSTVAAPAPVVGGPATPPDLSALYTKLVADQKREAGFNQGLNLLAAGFASPANRAALINAPTNTGPDPAATLQTLMAIRNDATKQQNTAVDRAALPGIAAKLGIDLPTATTLYNSGKLSDVLTDAAKPHTQISGDAKSGYRLVDLRTGKVIQEISEPVEKDETTTAAKKINDAQQNWQKYHLPDPNDPANKQFWSDFSNKVLAPGGQNLTVNAGDNVFDKQAAEKIYIPASQAGAAALDANHTLNTMRTLALTGKDDIPSGPAALIDLKARQGLASFLGVSLEGVPEAEGIQKLNQALATASVKAISSRPTQMEFAKALENNPGILQTRAGMMMMIEILKQDNDLKAKIGGMALDKANHGANWLTKVDDMYKNNPLKSPFDAGRSFGKEDLEILGDPKRTNIVDGKMYYKKGDSWFKADSN